MSKGSKLKNAVVYACSMYEGAKLSGQIEKMHDDVAVLLSLSDEGIDDFRRINNPIWDITAKEKIIAELCAKLKFCESTENSLKVMAENRRLDELRPILQHFNLIYNNERNIADVEVESAVALSKKQDALLKEKLAALFKKTINVRYKISPQILGGLVIRCGTVLIDSSVKHKLDSLEQLMKGTK